MLKSAYILDAFFYAVHSKKDVKGVGFLWQFSANIDLLKDLLKMKGYVRSLVLLCKTRA